MKRRLALLALLLVVPTHAAAEPTPRFPEAVLALGPQWIAEAEAYGAPFADRPWYPEAEAFLVTAREAQAQGRLRSVIFDLETYLELVATGQLVDAAEALPSAAEGKTLVLQRTGAWHAEALATWDAYRARLKDAQGDIRSLRGMEVALYSADQALGARLLTDDRDDIAREFPKQAGVERGYVMALVRSSRTALVNLQWADDLLGAVSAYEGLPPRMNETAWDVVVGLAMNPAPGNVPAHIQPIEDIAKDARANNETILAVMLGLAEQRASRATSIFVIYGDATSRGKNVSADATVAMGKQLDNTSMDLPAEHGLLGVFTADAIDRASKTREVARNATLDLGIVISAWVGLDHQANVLNTLAVASPVRPEEPPQDDDAPLGLLVPLAAAGLAALALRRRAR